MEVMKWLKTPTSVTSCVDYKRLARRSGDHHTSARDAADYSPVDAGLTSRVSVGPTLYRDGSRRSTLSQTNGTILIHIMRRDGELLGQQTGQFLGRF
jgi:hypothetical protein